MKRKFNGISFIVPAHNEERYIYDCVRSIHEEMVNYWPNLKYEVIVVDNNSTDATQEEAVRAVCWLEEEKRPGVVWARQKGLEVSDFDLVAFVDADGEMPEGWVQEALNSFNGGQYVVAVSGPLHFYDGSWSVNFGTKMFYKVAKLLHHIWPTVQGGNFIVEKSVLNKVGGFDTSYEFWGEDTRTAVILSKQGCIVLNPKMVMNTSARRLKNQGLISTTWTYITNYFSVSLFNKPTKKDYKNFR